MKHLKFIFATLIASAFVFVACEKDPVLPDDEGADYPELAAVEGKLVIAAKFEVEPCNDVVFIGTHVGWNSEDVAALPKFTPVGTVDGKEWKGWYKVEIELTEDAVAEKEGVDYLLAGKPVQLTADGSFSWDYQIGYNETSDVVVKAGDVDVYEGYAGECDIFYASSEPVAMVFAKWKKDPCATVTKRNYTFTVTVPAETGDNPVYIVGGFQGDYPSWDAGAESMKLTKQSNGTYTITLNDVEEGTEYKYVLNGSWDNEELAAIAEGETCANAIENRKTGSSEAVADKVENWRGVTTQRCE